MVKKTFRFSSTTVEYYFDANVSQLKKLVDQKHAIVLTDENVYKHHEAKFKGWNTIVLRAGEEHKVQSTVDGIIDSMIDMQADRKTTLIGIGGGVITDITGYTASIYMRGISFGMVPTSILGIVDASIGGKNGIDVGDYKNMVGVIRQPRFILQDAALLASLPNTEWENGFAEIIKHACIKDAAMFKELSAQSIESYRRQRKSLSNLIARNALIKTKVVQIDEFEQGERRLLNFGHTLGHALETQYELLHGQAISIGMVAACHISEQLTGFKQTEQVVQLFERYGLPTYANFDKQRVFNILRMDKKRERKEMNYILLDKIGKGVVRSIPLTKLEQLIAAL